MVVVMSVLVPAVIAQPPSARACFDQPPDPKLQGAKPCNSLTTLAELRQSSMQTGPALPCRTSASFTASSARSSQMIMS